MKVCLILQRRNSVHNDLFSIGPFTIHGYGVMIAIGVLAAYMVMMKRARRLNIDSSPMDSLTVWVLVGGAIGAKVLFWFTQIGNILQNPSLLLLTITDGFVVYGGIIGGVLAGYIYCRKKQIGFLKYFDLIIPSVALAQGFGRIGCFMAGCCYGRETDSAFGVMFPTSSLAPGGVPLIPTQLISSGLDFLLFAALIVYAKRKKAEGQVAALYLILYSGGRFILEFFRGDIIRGSVGMLSTSQFIAIFLFLIGCGMFIARQYKAAISLR
nr:prolipoprotein diacylglyceryl transferase [Paenibacillus sp. 79R4]